MSKWWRFASYLLAISGVSILRERFGYLIALGVLLVAVGVMIGAMQMLDEDRRERENIERIKQRARDLGIEVETGEPE